MQKLVTPIMAGDVSHLARLLLTFQPHMRAAVAGNVIDRAIVANSHRVNTNNLHPEFGNGSILMAAANFGRKLPAEPRYDDADYVASTITALSAIQSILNTTDAMAAE